MVIKILKRKDLITLFLIILFFTAIYSFIGWQKHQHFQTFAWDTAFFDQQAYFISNLKPPYTSVGKMNGLGDHFHIIFLILASIAYNIWSDPRTLFIIQSVVISLSAVPLYLLSQHLLKKTHLKGRQINILSLFICLTYLGGVSFQTMAVDEFHNDPLATLPLFFIFYFLLKQNHIGYWVSLVVLFLTKETYGLFAVPLGLYMALTTREYKKAIVTAFFGILVFTSLVYYLMPYLAERDEYFHFSQSNRPGFVLSKILKNPLLSVSQLIDHPDKRETIAYSLFQFGFLPLLSPSSLIMPVFSLAIRFYDQSTPILYQFNNHYSIPLMAFLAVATPFGALKFIKFLSGRKIKNSQILGSLSLYLVAILIVQNYLLHGPVNSLAKKGFYKYENWEKDAHELIGKVPKDVTIASKNSLLPHLSQRDEFYLLPEIGDAEYIAVDLADGPNKFAPIDQPKMEKLIKDLMQKRKFKIVWQKNQAMLLKKT